MIIALFLQLLDQFFVSSAKSNPPSDITLGGGTTGGSTAPGASLLPHAHQVLSQIPTTPQTGEHLPYFLAFFYYCESLSIILPWPHMIFAAIIIIAITSKKVVINLVIAVINVLRGAGVKV